MKRMFFGVSKFRSKKIKADGIVFDSKAEAQRYLILRAMLSAGIITDLKLQPIFILQEGFIYLGRKVRAITYRADFSYYENGVEIIEDVKGFPTETFLLKAKWFIKLHILGSTRKYYLIKRGVRKEAIG